MGGVSWLCSRRGGTERDRSCQLNQITARISIIYLGVSVPGLRLKPHPVAQAGGRGVRRRRRPAGSWGRRASLRQPWRRVARRLCAPAQPCRVRQRPRRAAIQRRAQPQHRCERMLVANGRCGRYPATAGRAGPLRQDARQRRAGRARAGAGCGRAGRRCAGARARASARTHAAGGPPGAGGRCGGGRSGRGGRSVAGPGQGRGGRVGRCARGPRGDRIALGRG